MSCSYWLSHFHHSKAFLLSNWRHFLRVHLASVNSGLIWLSPFISRNGIQQRKVSHIPLHSFLACNIQHKILHHESELASILHVRFLQVTFDLHYLTIFYNLMRKLFLFSKFYRWGNSGLETCLREHSQDPNWDSLTPNSFTLKCPTFVLCIKTLNLCL